MITNWILFIITLLLGYLLGKLSNYPLPTINVLKKGIMKAVDFSPVGAVKRPTSEELAKKEDKVRSAEEEEMRKAFSNIKIK